MAVKWPWKRNRARFAWWEIPVEWPAPGPPQSAGSLIVAPGEGDVLARYNAERARGIMHTPEWQEKMAEKMAELQERYEAARGKRQP
jgi:hypothetical protein